MDALICKVLMEHHIFPNKKGYRYMQSVLRLMMEGGCKALYLAYEKTAIKYGIKANSVEKCISNAIESSFNSVDIASRYGMYASAKTGKITNKRFFDILINEIHNK